MEDLSSLGALARRHGAISLPTDAVRRSRAQAWGRGATKRFLDIVAASAALFFLSPLLLAVAALVRVSSRGPVLFSHTRIGRQGTTFGCLKFRTMRHDADAVLQRYLASDPAARDEWARTQKLRRDPRVTPLGDVLRKTSVDELPQLINVIKGDMSLVGPRPIVDGEKIRYGRHFHDYCRVKPGVTGLWQISGRNDVSYQRRVLLDKFYVRKRSLRLDFYIIAKTIPAVLKAKGSY